MSGSLFQASLEYKRQRYILGYFKTGVDAARALLTWAWFSPFSPPAMTFFLVRTYHIFAAPHGCRVECA